MTAQKATFIGIGAQKCASTWLYGVLAQCPDVQLSDEKEVDFFSYYFDRGYEWYERHLCGSAPRRHRGEISPSYFVHPAAADRAAAYNADLHILVTLRDPVERAYSNHLHEVRKGHISGANLVFETAMDNNPLYLDQGNYAQHLAVWRDAFPETQIHVLFQEDIHVDRVAATQQVTEALGLPSLENLVDRRANESVRYRNPVVGNTLWRVGHAARRAGLGQVVEQAKALPGIRHMHQSNREGLRDTVDALKADTETRLTDYYAPEVAALEKMLGRAVPWPRFH